MILCVDIGNTSIKIARVAERRVHGFITIPSAASAEEITRALSRTARGGVDRVAVASVRPQSTAIVRAAIRRTLLVNPLLVTSRAKLPIEIETRRPARVGADRICAACGALPGSARNSIIVDAGSAITVDLVIGRRFLGGLIMAGPQTALSALHRFTAQLPDLEFGEAEGERFDDTASAMLTGARVGSAGAIQAAVEFLESRASRRGIPVWLTGGYAPRLQKRLPSRYKYMPGLTLIGLAEIARQIR